MFGFFMSFGRGMNWSEELTALSLLVTLTSFIAAFIFKAKQIEFYS